MGFGALHVVSDQKLLVNSRIYSKPSGGDLRDTVGQFFAAIPASFAIGSGQSTTLLGVYQTSPQADSQFRYNFGFVETTGAAVAVRVTAYDETGTAVGSKDYALAGYEARQYGIADLLPAVNSQNLRLAVEVLSGGGKVVAFGSSLANKSNDPSTFEMSFREDLLSNGSGGFTLPYSGSGASSGTLFQLTNTASGNAIVAVNSASGNYVELASGARALRAVAFAGAALWGQSASDFGVIGSSASADGVRGESATGNKSGVYGVNSDGSGYGVFGRNSATGSVGYLGGLFGVQGLATRSLTHGGYFEASGGLAAGVYGKSTAALGFGAVFEATGNDSYGLLAVGPASPNRGLAGVFRGNVQVRRRTDDAVLIELGEGLDYAEGFKTAGDSRITAGSVLVIDDAQPGRLVLAARQYDRRVAGVVAGANGLGSGVRLAPGQFDHDVALAGRVYCNVDATYGEVRPGDLLTTSPTPGYAMVAHNTRRAAGAILGKAMQPLLAGRRGQILVLVTLQ
jgi:hypothetical protein